MPLAGRFTLEMIGTYFLVLVVSCAAVGMMAGDLAPLAIGGILAAMIFMAGPHCGAHFNPAVSVALMVRGAFPASEVAPYIAAQLIGAVLAALTQMVIIESSNGSEATAIVVAALGENGGFIPDLAQIALAELVFTFALVLVILHVATTKEQEGNQYFGLAIGLTVMAGAFAVGPISGAVFNPAVLAGLFILGALPVAHSVVILLTTFAGGLLAALAFRAIHANNKG